MNLLLLVLLTVCSARKLPKFAEQLSGDELVDYVNSRQSFFKAVKHDFTPEEMLQRAMDKKYREPMTTNFAKEIDSIKDEQIPVSFDSREHWYNCPSIGAVRDQAQCASCWAFGAAEVISDRICVASNGTLQPIISPEDILTCCSAWQSNCGSCDGGYPDYALNFYSAKGVVTGGGYDSKIGCKSYAFSPCSSHNGYYYGRCPSSVATPACTESCDENYKVTYAKDKHFGTPSYRVQSFNVAAIQKEIMTNGPVIDCFDLYSDMYNYKSGVYVHTAGSYLGGHCVKLIGWGVDTDGTPYWTAANSWNSDFGENGFFRVIRGLNEVSFEEFIYATIPTIPTN